MATKAQQQAMIDLIAPLSVKEFKQYGKPLPSVCIGMAAIESAWGTAGSVKYHSYMGHKVGSGKTALQNWGGQSFNAKTKEFVNNKYIGINSNFRAYDSEEQCIANFYELLNTPLYAGVSKTTSYVTQMQEIKKCGYMTSPTEVQSVIQIIESHDLHTLYDGKVLAYFKIPIIVTTSIVEALDSIKENSNYSNRKAIAKANGFVGYTGSISQNTKLVKLLYEGKLIKP